MIVLEKQKNIGKTIFQYLKDYTTFKSLFPVFHVLSSTVELDITSSLLPDSKPGAKKKWRQKKNHTYHSTQTCLCCKQDMKINFNTAFYILHKQKMIIEKMSIHKGFVALPCRIIFTCMARHFKKLPFLASIGNFFFHITLVTNFVKYLLQ